MDAIKDAIGDDITTLNEEIKRFRGQQGSRQDPGKAQRERTKASEADPFQQNAMAATLSPEEEAQLDGNLRGLALLSRGTGRATIRLSKRAKSSRYILDFRHDEYWPFDHVKHRFLPRDPTINTAHPFFTALYDPVAKMVFHRRARRMRTLRSSMVPRTARSSPSTCCCCRSREPKAGLRARGRKGVHPPEVSRGQERS